MSLIIYLLGRVGACTFDNLLNGTIQSRVQSEQQWISHIHSDDDDDAAAAADIELLHFCCLFLLFC